MAQWVFASAAAAAASVSAVVAAASSPSKVGLLVLLDGHEDVLGLFVFCCGPYLYLSSFS